MESKQNWNWVKQFFQKIEYNENNEIENELKEIKRIKKKTW